MVGFIFPCVYTKKIFFFQLINLWKLLSATMVNKSLFSVFFNFFMPIHDLFIFNLDSQKTKRPFQQSWTLNENCLFKYEASSCRTKADT